MDKTEDGDETDSCGFTVWLSLEVLGSIERASGDVLTLVLLAVTVRAKSGPEGGQVPK